MKEVEKHFQFWSILAASPLEKVTRYFKVTAYKKLFDIFKNKKRDTGCARPCTYTEYVKTQVWILTLKVNFSIFSGIIRIEAGFKTNDDICINNHLILRILYFWQVLRTSQDCPLASPPTAWQCQRKSLSTQQRHSWQKQGEPWDSSWDLISSWSGTSLRRSSSWS